MNPLKLAILSRSNEIYSTRRLIEAAEDRGHNIILLDPLRAQLDFENSKPTLRTSDGPFSLRIDALIPRVGTQITNFGAMIVQHFEAAGVFSLNGAESILRARDKMRAFQILAHERLPLPDSHLINLESDMHFFLNSKAFGTSQKIVKVLDGSQGEGVYLINTHEDFLEISRSLRLLEKPFLLQEFISESNGEDIRLFVIGDEVVASMKRKSNAHDFRSNLHQGGSATNYNPTKTEIEIAIRATEALNLHVAGVDIIQSKRGPLLLEVNASPGLEGIESVSGINVAKKIIEYTENILTTEP